MRTCGKTINENKYPQMTAFKGRISGKYRIPNIVNQRHR